METNHEYKRKLHVISLAFNMGSFVSREKNRKDFHHLNMNDFSKKKATTNCFPFIQMSGNFSRT
jgi:hypothetical protein